MFLTVKRCIHTKFGWIWSSELSASNTFSFKSVENWNFAGPQKASKQAEADDVLNCSESLTFWEFKIFWIFKIGQLLLHKQLTSNLCNFNKLEISCLSRKSWPICCLRLVHWTKFSQIWCECIFWQSKTFDMVESKFHDTCFQIMTQRAPTCIL